MYINQHLSLHFGAKILNILEKERFCMDTYQFITLQKGSVTIHYEETNETLLLQKGDVLLIEPGHPYFCAPHTPSILLGIRIDGEFLLSLLEPDQHFVCDSTKGPHRSYQQLHQLLIRMCSAYYTENNHYALLSLIFELADMMKKQFVETAQTSISASERLIQTRTTAIKHYLQTSYHMPISLELLADKMFLSPQYLSKFIKKHLGYTFSHYLAQIRLEHAHEQLVNTDDSITAIALNNGFPNIAAFHKVFREAYHTSPGSYRIQYRKEHPWIADEPNANTPQLEPVSLSIHVSALTMQPYVKPWCDTINIGSLPEALKISFHDNFLEYQKYLPIKYVRFTDIFSEEIVYLDEKTNVFNFTTLDEVLEFFYLAGVVPFVELAEKPRKTHIYSNAATTWNDYFHPEKPDYYYHRLLSALLVHCLQRFGRSYVSQWRFEFWMKHEEGLKYNSQKFGAYFKKYQAYYQLIKSLVPECSVGGPGFNMCGNMQCFREFIQEADRRGILFDFISLYGFSYETQNFTDSELNDTQGIIAPSGSHIYDSFFKYKSFLESTCYRNRSVYITELGSLVAMENYIADSVFQACFLCHNMLQFINHCTNVAYLSFWDNSADMSIPNSQYYPGASLIDENGIPKPAFHGYSFLAHLGKYLISKGDAYIFTCNSSNQFQLMLYHYTHYSDAFCTNSWENLPLEHTYEAFRQEEPLRIHFSCGDFPAGRYKVTRYSLNRGYGSILDKHLRTLHGSDISSRELLHSLLNLKEDESRYFKQTSIPRQDIYYITTDGILTLNITLASHEIIFYEFSRIF